MSDCVRDRLWLWGHQAGGFNGQYGLPCDSSITPAEAAEWMGIPNVAMVVYGGQPRPPFEPAARPLAGVKKLVWSAIGDGTPPATTTALISTRCWRWWTRAPIFAARVLDDFFNSPPGRPGEYRCDLPTLRAMADRLHQAPRRQDLWMVLYTHQLALPIADYLACADLVTFWTWKPAELERLEENFSRAEAMVRGKSNSPDPAQATGAGLLHVGPRRQPADAYRRRRAPVPSRPGVVCARQNRGNGLRQFRTGRHADRRRPMDPPVDRRSGRRRNQGGGLAGLTELLLRQDVLADLSLRDSRRCGFELATD